MKKALIFTQYDFIQVKGFAELRTATQQYDSQQCWICDITGRVQIQFVPGPESISLYHSSAQSLMMLHDWENFRKRLPEILTKVAEGKWYCDHCNKWKLPKRFHHYSFAGVVCDKCYDPKVHLPPNTMGD